MSSSFKLSVPADLRYRAVVLDVTAKCAELAGGSAADGQALAEAVAATVNGMGLDLHAQLDLAFRLGRGGVEVTASASGRSSTIHHPIAVSKP